MLNPRTTIIFSTLQDGENHLESCGSGFIIVFIGCFIGGIVVCFICIKRW